MDDLISRRAAIGVVKHAWAKGLEPTQYLEELPSAQPERKKGEWIQVKGSNGKEYHKCSKCLHTQEITGVKNYCAVCGADMRGEKDENNGNDNNNYNYY